jgi:hypothetical protein
VPLRHAQRDKLVRDRHYDKRSVALDLETGRDSIPVMRAGHEDELDVLLPSILDTAFRGEL